MGSMYSSHCLTTEKSLNMPVANRASIGVSCANVDTYEYLFHIQPLNSHYADLAVS